MIIYLNSDFICHLTNDGTMTEVETDVFNGKADAFIGGYRYIPEGETWTRADGVQFHGLMIAPAKNYDRILTDVAISYLDDDQAETVTALFPEWETSKAYAVGDRVKYNGLLYRCVQAHTSQADWTPDVVPALWVRTSTEEWPEWIQPTGAQDAYNKGDKVTYKGEHYICLIDGNVWSPDDYPQGWEKK